MRTPRPTPAPSTPPNGQSILFRLIKKKGVPVTLSRPGALRRTWHWNSRGRNDARASFSLRFRAFRRLLGRSQCPWHLPPDLYHFLFSVFPCWVRVSRQRPSTLLQPRGRQSVVINARPTYLQEGGLHSLLPPGSFGRRDLSPTASAGISLSTFQRGGVMPGRRVGHPAFSFPHRFKSRCSGHGAG